MFKYSVRMNRIYFKCQFSYKDRSEEILKYYKLAYYKIKKDGCIAEWKLRVGVNY